MAAKVFISYRREDSAGHAGRVHDRLGREFGRDLLFMDVDGISFGANFVKVLGEKVATCDVLLAIIGPGWVDARDENGQRRLDNPDDFVRIEIAAALKRDIPVIPILLEGVEIPKAHQLPDDLKDLALRQALNVRHASFHADMDKLIHGLRGWKPSQQVASMIQSWSQNFAPSPFGPETTPPVPTGEATQSSVPEWDSVFGSLENSKLNFTVSHRGGPRLRTSQPFCSQLYRSLHCALQRCTCCRPGGC
jgi:hypothetical protein